MPKRIRLKLLLKLKTDRLVLRRPEKRHNACLANLWRDKKVREYLGEVISKSTHQNSIALINKGIESKNYLSYPEENATIGI